MFTIGMFLSSMNMIIQTVVWGKNDEHQKQNILIILDENKGWYDFFIINVSKDQYLKNTIQ